MGLEMESVRRFLAELGKGEDLEAAAVRENRPVPSHELVEAACFSDDVHARAEIQMVCVAKDDLRL